MGSSTAGTETTTWFATTNPSRPHTTQYELSQSSSIEPAASPKQAVVEAIVDVTEPPGGQTSLTLYEQLDPDALDALIESSADKCSHVEVRFTFEACLIIVRSTGTVLVYEPL